MFLWNVKMSSLGCHEMPNIFDVNTSNEWIGGASSDDVLGDENWGWLLFYLLSDRQAERHMLFNWTAICLSSSKVSASLEMSST